MKDLIIVGSTWQLAKQEFFRILGEYVKAQPVMVCFNSARLGERYVTAVSAQNPNCLYGFD